MLLLTFFTLRSACGSRSTFYSSELVNEYQKLFKSAEEYFYPIFFIFLSQLKLEKVIFS